MRFSLLAGVIASCVLSMPFATAVKAGSSPIPPLSMEGGGHAAEDETVIDDEGSIGGDDSLGAAIVQAYAYNPSLAAGRYDLRASQDDLGIALAKARPTARIEIEGGYGLTLPGRVTQVSRSTADRLAHPNIEANNLTSQLVIDQPIYTGGRVSSAIATAKANIAAGRESLRGDEGDMLVDLVTAYSDVRRDRRVIAIREAGVRVLQRMFDEIVARRDAGQLTQTDVAQADTQLQAARAQLDSSRFDLQSSRASFAAIVGREAGELLPPPTLPGLPATLEEAFEIAQEGNPDLRQALAQQSASRAEIAVARAEAHPSLAIEGTAGTDGQALPFHARDQDVEFSGRAVLTIPLLAGGKLRAQLAQAKNRESADRMRVEATRRQVIQAIVNYWNYWVTAERNVATRTLQFKAAQIYYEGTTEEYREGLRSTLDALYAQNSLRDAEVELLSSQRDSYVAQASLLRQLGRLEAEQLVVSARTYDPENYARTVARRSAVPWDGMIRVIDRLGAPSDKPQRIIALPASAQSSVRPAAPVSAKDLPLATSSSVDKGSLRQ